MNHRIQSSMRRSLVALCLACAGAVGTASGDQSSSEEIQGALLMRREFADRMPDPILINHRGEQVHFFSDLVDGQAVVINFFYADCKGSCPTTNVAIRRLRSEFSKTFGRSVRFLSITLRAEEDTPEVIERYGKANAVESGNPDLPDWQFLTGNPDDIRALRKHLGMVERDPVLDADPSQHSAMLVVGNHATGRWSKINPLTRGDLVRQKVQRIIGWTQAQRYAHIREAVASSQDTLQQSSPATGPTPPPPQLGPLTESFSGVERSETPVSSGMIQGKVTVFGRIYTICPHGSQAVVATMKRLNDEFGSTGRFHLVALAPTTDRETPSFFRSFANLAGTSESDPWWFVSMETNALSRFATTGLGLNPPRPIPEEERLNPLEDHEYDLRLVLVDADGKIRGRYEVFHADWAKGDAAAHQLETDTRHLLALP